jgi:hypothetical protein
MGEKYITDFEGAVRLCGINSSVFEIGRVLDACRQRNKLRIISFTNFNAQYQTIPDAVRIQFVLLKMDMLMLETCRG